MAITENITIGAHFSAIVCSNKNSIKWDHEYESARSALYAILVAHRPQNVWVPYYICDAVIDAIKKSNSSAIRYKINNNFNPESLLKIGPNDLVILVNYYGLHSLEIKKQLNIYPRNQVIIDCSQALFDQDFECLASIYSPRKFLPTPDGGGIFYKGELPLSPPSNQESIKRYQYLLQRIADEPEISRESYLCAEHELEDIGLRKMSDFTGKLIRSIDTDYIKNKRRQNFLALDSLRKVNELNIELSESVPLCYPLINKKAGELRNHLIQQRVLTPKYWPNVEPIGTFEARLINDAIFLPIDHRYDVTDMLRVSSLIKKFLGVDE